MSNERLTRQELSWLLAQEARGAAKALREGVSQLKPVIISETPRDVDASLDVLDDAISVLSALQQSPGRGRRGRIDLAALLYQVAPSARISMEPGGGTEVFGEEAELVRMLHVLITQSSTDPAGGNASPEVGIRREGDFVKVSVALGPDTSATADVERRWLSRMAVRYGGRLELEGAVQSISLPADGASDQRELAELRRELEQAQQLGEAYARELAAAFTAGSLPSDRTSVHPAEVATARFEMLRATAASFVRLLRDGLEGLRNDAALAVTELGHGAPLVHSLQWRIAAGHELAGELERIAECPGDEPAKPVDLSALARDVAAAAETRAARHGVLVALELPEQVVVKGPRTALAVLLRALLDHAIAATPKGETATLHLARTEGGVRLAVEDGGPAVPEAARGDLLRRRVDPTSFGRPAGPALLVADSVAAHLRCPLEMAESSAGRTEVRGVLSAEIG